MKSSSPGLVGRAALSRARGGTRLRREHDRYARTSSTARSSPADIGNNQVRSRRRPDDALPHDGLTGADIVEGSLGPVPNADTLDGKDSKDFARLGGLVNGDGSISQGSGFTVSHPDDGEYQISFPNGTLSNANCPPLATAMVFSGIVRHPQISGRGCSGLGAGSFTIKTLDNDGVAHDTPFVFMGM